MELVTIFILYLDTENGLNLSMLSVIVVMIMLLLVCLCAQMSR